MAELIGQHLGQYEITGLLGYGGMATVYRARQTSIQRDVAVKVIEAYDSDFLKRFEREAQMIASLNHAHILKVFDYGREDNIVYLVMELLRGGTVANVIGKGALRAEVVYRFLEQVAPALDYAHRKGIIHRDLKPQNLLIDEAGNIQLTDFGLAKLVNETSAMTHSGFAMGTPAYMAPEQWTSDTVDARSDVYSLGVILFEMLAGRVPFKGDNPFRLMHMHIHELPPSLCNFKPDLPTSIDLVIQQSLAKDPDARFNSARELANAFKNAFVNRVRTGMLPDLPAAQPPQSSVDVAVPKAKRLTVAAGVIRKDEREVAQVWVPAGTFFMGSNGDPAARNDEQPYHEVQITQGFWLDQTPVTNAAYDQFVVEAGYTTRQYWSNSGWQWLTSNGIQGPGTYPGFAQPQQPRVGVSWYEADAYARWRGGRLPTEAEWEYAARGPQALRYPWGNDYRDNIANVSSTKTKNVGSHPEGKSWVDAFDMVGNIWEWIADWYDEQYYRQDIGPDPSGPTSGKTRVLRGGSWRHDKNLARAAARRHDGPSTRDDYIGFRIVSVAANR